MGDLILHISWSADAIMDERLSIKMM